MPDQYPAWAAPFAAFVVFFMGLFTIYAASAFINLDADAAHWDTLDRIAVVVLAFLWGRYVTKSFSELGDAEQE